MTSENSVLFMTVQEENYTVVSASALTPMFPTVVYPSDTYRDDSDSALAWDDVDTAQLVKDNPELLVRANMLRRGEVPSRPLKEVAEELGITV